ncbi:MAG: hypothetical protein ACXAAO_03975 [Candidatus Thorarchaeota archaeon]
MTRPRLRLLSTSPRIENHTPLYVDVDSARLWNLVNDDTVHLVLRKPALQELARRQDPHLMDYCEGLLRSDEYETWLTAVSTLVSLGTTEAVDRLIMVYAQSLNEKRRLVLSMVAKVLTAEHVKPFSIMVRGVAVPGELDVSDWTKTAISTLHDVCKRFGIDVIGVYIGSKEELATLDTPELDEITSIPEK